MNLKLMKCMKLVNPANPTPTWGEHPRAFMFERKERRDEREKEERHERSSVMYVRKTPAHSVSYYHREERLAVVISYHSSHFILTAVSDLYYSKLERMKPC